jgi:hypothetical protein
MIMKKYVTGVKSILATALVIGGCFTVLVTGAAFAETAANVSPQATVNQSQDSVDPILQKQREIDQYVFEQHKADFEKKGITVTQTSPQNGYVEIGITPYNNANADYLYGIFGKDQVKVVEGEEAVTLGTNAAASTVTEAADPVSGNESSSPFTLISIAAAVVILGAAAFAVRKLRVARR